MEESITAIIPSYRRHENIPIIIDKLKKQTYPPKDIIVWNDNSGKFGKNFTIDDPTIKVVNTNIDINTFGAYLIAYTSFTKYIAIIDDDMAPGPKWFEFCVKKQKETPGLYGAYGITFYTDGKGILRNHFESKCDGGRLREVDMIGTSYFFPYKSINYFLSERPPFLPSITDMHLCFTSQKYGSLKCYVVFPNEPEELPSYYNSELPYNHNERAACKDDYHYSNRGKYFSWAAKKGWKFIKLGGYNDHK